LAPPTANRLEFNKSIIINCDEIIEDGLGGIFGKKESKTGSKSLMLAGHLDEIQ
jgi:putative aminopeptidase FrvX